MAAPLAYCRTLGTRLQWLPTIDIHFRRGPDVISARGPRLNVE